MLHITIYRTNASIIKVMKPFYAQKVYPKGHKIGMRKYITKGPSEDKHYWSSYAHNTFNLSLPYVLPVCTIDVFFNYLGRSPNSPLSCFLFFSFWKLKTLILQLNPLSHTHWQTRLLYCWSTNWTNRAHPQAYQKPFIYYHSASVSCACSSQSAKI